MPMMCPESGPLVSADWVESQLDMFQEDDPTLRLLEVDMEPEVYGDDHIPGAVGLDWEDDLAGRHGRNIVSKGEFESLMGSLGITEETTVVIYGDKANWFASHAYWLFTYYGHESVALMDGGRHYWLVNDYPTTTDVPSFSSREYEAEDPDESIRAYAEDVESMIEADTTLIDVRSPEEYRGRPSRPGADAEAEVGGHIPGAENVHWGEAVDPDGRFKARGELADIYSTVDGDGAVTYCQIGERASLSWFVLHELLGIEASNYIDSWLEWASREGAPIARGE